MSLDLPRPQTSDKIKRMQTKMPVKILGMTNPNNNVAEILSSVQKRRIFTAKPRISGTYRPKSSVNVGKLVNNTNRMRSS